MASGEIDVTGKGNVQIALLAKPKHVGVRFIDDPILIPCNHHHHHHHDKLEYEIEHFDEDPRAHRDLVHQHQNRQYLLFIKWEVSEIRKIHWTVTY